MQNSFSKPISLNVKNLSGERSLTDTDQGKLALSRLTVELHHLRQVQRVHRHRVQDLVVGPVDRPTGPRGRCVVVGAGKRKIQMDFFAELKTLGWQWKREDRSLPSSLTPSVTCEADHQDWLLHVRYSCNACQGFKRY